MIEPILAIAGAAVLAGIATFAFFGGYWYELLRCDNEEDNQ